MRPVEIVFIFPVLDAFFQLLAVRELVPPVEFLLSGPVASFRLAVLFGATRVDPVVGNPLGHLSVRLKG